jgi:hypothetical protein
VKPNFSGEWVLNREASTLSPSAASFLGAVWQIEHRDPVFHHKASFATAGDPIQYEYELQSDGREVTATNPQGTSTVSSCTWDGDALIVRFVTRWPDGDMSISFRYELLDAGTRLCATEELRGTDHDQDNVWVFDRR